LWALFYGFPISARHNYGVWASPYLESRVDFEILNRLNYVIFCC